MRALRRVHELLSSDVGPRTIQRRKCAIESAESGTLRDAADLTRAAMSESGEVAGILGTLGYGIPALPVTYTGPATRPDLAMALEDHDGRPGLARLVVPVEEASKALRWGLTLGGVPIQIKHVAATDRDAPGLLRATRTIEVWDPRWLRYQWASDTYHLMTSTGEICIEDHPTEFQLYCPYGRKKFWDLATWKFLTLYYILSRDALFDHARHSAVNAPVRVAKSGKGWSEPQRRVVEKLMKDMIRNNWIMFPDVEDSFEFKSAPGADQAQVYELLANRCVKSIEIGLTGNVVTTEGSSGFSGPDVHERVAGSFKSFYAISWATWCAKYPLRLWAEDCAGQGAGVDQVYDTESPAEKEARGKAFGELGEGLSKLKDGLDAFAMELEPGSLLTLLSKQGLRARPKPGTTKAVKLDLAPTDLAKAFTIDEVRAT